MNRLVKTCVSLFVLVSVYLPVSAQGTIRSERCERIQLRIGNLISVYDKNHPLHVEKYKAVYTKISDEVLPKLETAGFTVTQLKTDLVTLNTQIAEYSAAKAKLVEKLREVESVSCSSATGSTLVLVREARQKVLEYRRIAKEDMYATLQKIKADLFVIRAENNK